MKNQKYIMKNRNGSMDSVTGINPDAMVQRLFKNRRVYLFSDKLNEPVTVCLPCKTGGADILGSVIVYEK
jgi:hypothetical protein